MLYVSRLGIAFCMEEYIDPTTIKFHHICYRECFRGIVTNKKEIWFNLKSE